MVGPPLIVRVYLDHFDFPRPWSNVPIRADRRGNLELSVLPDEVMGAVGPLAARCLGLGPVPALPFSVRSKCPWHESGYLWSVRAADSYDRICRLREQSRERQRTRQATAGQTVCPGQTRDTPPGQTPSAEKT